ncbi:MAG: hypothetical protein PHX18_08475 [Candidatus Gastranaerophilales bacterium]|nr:hypothetical protein [Candidatus Gastranaerophilales bacterium]
MKNVYVKDGRLFIEPRGNFNAEKTVYEIEQLAQETENSNISLDLRGFNMFVALRIGILASTTIFISSINSSFEIIVDSMETKKYLDSLALSNLQTKFSMPQQKLALACR